MIQETPFFSHIINETVKELLTPELFEYFRKSGFKKFAGPISMNHYYKQSVVRVLFRLNHLTTSVSKLPRLFEAFAPSWDSLYSDFETITKEVKRYSIEISTIRDLCLKLSSEVLFLGLDSGNCSWAIISRNFWVKHHNIDKKLGLVYQPIKKFVEHRNLVVHENDESLLNEFFEEDFISLVGQLGFGQIREIYSPLEKEILAEAKLQVSYFRDSISDTNRKLEEGLTALMSSLFQIFQQNENRSFT